MSQGLEVSGYLATITGFVAVGRVTRHHPLLLWTRGAVSYPSSPSTCRCLYPPSYNHQFIQFEDYDVTGFCFSFGSQFSAECYCKR